ncbi:MAG: UDP-N-acetylmuramoyl-tripeptide--D-alanyl-D-alanine ligase, partial [bacterium]
KGELLENLGKGEACLAPTAVLNADNRWTQQLIKKTTARVMRFGIDNEAEVMAGEIRYCMEGVSFVLEAMETRLQVDLPLMGKVNIYNALAAAAVGFLSGCDGDQIWEGLRRETYQEGRMRKVSTANGKLILNDTYNSNPASLRMAIELLGGLPWERRRVAILGDMLELGDFSRAEHEAIGSEKVRKCCDLLITYGTDARYIGEGARRAGMSSEAVFHFDNFFDFAQRAGGLLKSGDLILVKGSRGMKMEEIVSHLQKISTE